MPVPAYTDAGVIMAPLRPLCQAMHASLEYRNGRCTVVRAAPEPSGIPLIVDLQVNSVRAQRRGRINDARRLSLPVEERIGTLFAPARDVAAALDATLEPGSSPARLLLRDADSTVELRSPAIRPYSGRDASRLTLRNMVGRALSVRLFGPQGVDVELGRRQEIALVLRPGVYYYRGGSQDMTARAGARRLLPGTHAVWVWGRR